MDGLQGGEIPLVGLEVLEERGTFRGDAPPTDEPGACGRQQPIRDRGSGPNAKAARRRRRTPDEHAVPDVEPARGARSFSAVTDRPDLLCERDGSGHHLVDRLEGLL